MTTGMLLQGLSTWCQLAASAWLSSIWQASVLALAVALCLRMTPRITAAVRYFAWITVLMVFVLLPFVSTFATRPAASVVVPSLHIDVRWSFAIAGLWAGLSIFRGVQLLQSALRLRGIARRATPVASRCRVELSLGKSRSAVLCASQDVARPSVIGFFSPRILIPAGLLPRLSETELDHIVLHEMEHLRRRDDWVNLLQKIGLVLFPLNPALLWVERRVCLERELACDDGVLRATKTPKAYASSLVNLAEHSILGRPVSLALGAWERRPELARRVQHILRSRPDAGHGAKTSRAYAGAAVLVAGLFMGAAVLSRSPQLVSFVDANAVVASGDSPAAISIPQFTRGYQPVVFHEQAAGGYHATLLKATLLKTTSVKAPLPISPAATKVAKHVPAKHRATRQRAKEQNPEQAWITTSDYVSAQPIRIVRVVYAARGDRQISESYAAVHTYGGWLVIQL